MNLQDLHEAEKDLSAVKLFTGDKGIVSALQLKKDGVLKEHLTKIPALLLCVTGKITYHEAEREIELNPGDYVDIPTFVNHWLVGIEESQLVLIR